MTLEASHQCKTGPLQIVRKTYLSLFCTRILTVSYQLVRPSISAKTIQNTNFELPYGGRDEFAFIRFGGDVKEASLKMPLSPKAVHVGSPNAHQRSLSDRAYVVRLGASPMSKETYLRQKRLIHVERGLSDRAYIARLGTSPARLQLGAPPDGAGLAPAHMIGLH